MIFINVFFMMFSLISIEINNFYIVGFDNIINLLLDIKKQDYLNMLNYINFKIIIRMRLLEKITLIKITLKSELIKKLIKKFIGKNNLKDNFKSGLKYNFKKVLIKLICKMFKIAEIKLSCAIGLSRADITAITTGILNCFMSSIIAYYFTKESKNKVEIESKNIKYYIRPIYSEKVEIKMHFIIGISSKIY